MFKCCPGREMVKYVPKLASVLPGYCSKSDPSSKTACPDKVTTRFQAAGGIPLKDAPTPACNEAPHMTLSGVIAIQKNAALHGAVRRLGVLSPAAPHPRRFSSRYHEGN
jgi:hypothetical protein